MSNKAIAFVAVVVMILGLGALKAARRPPPEPEALFSLSVTDENGKHVDIRIGKDGKFVLRSRQPRQKPHHKVALAKAAPTDSTEDSDEDQDDESDE